MALPPFPSGLGHEKAPATECFGIRTNDTATGNWGKAKYLKHIDEIAEFLEVSPGYLLRGIEDGPEEGTKAAVEDEMLRVFRKLSPKKQGCVI